MKRCHGPVEDHQNVNTLIKCLSSRAGMKIRDFAVNRYQGSRLIATVSLQRIHAQLKAVCVEFPSEKIRDVDT